MDRWIRPEIVRYCRARLGGTAQSFAAADGVAKDVCHEVLASSAQRRHRSWLAFVYDIAARQVERNAGAMGPETDADPVRKLPDRQREILILRVVVGLSAEQTAEALGLTPSEVRYAQHRALSSLRTALTG
jgi:RNA polymerase sigma-70 factor (ECF subfamily)